jgi:ribonuclease HII
MIEDDKSDHLEKIGVKDSKLLTSCQRERIEPQIKKISKNYAYSILSPENIDKAVRIGKKLNFLEAKTMADLISKLKPDIVYVDAVGQIAERFAFHICRNYKMDLKIIAEHKADTKYPIVSAASILAKVKRDGIISELKTKYGNFGSGYPSDQKTKQFVGEWIKKFGKAPPFARKSWATIRKFEYHELSYFESFNPSKDR